MASKRRWSERLLLVVNLCVANVVAALWIATFLQPSTLGSELGVATGLADKPRAMVLPLQTPAAWLAFFGSVGLILWNFAWLVRRREGRQPDNWIMSQTDGGGVRVAREAVEAAVRQAGEALPEVTRLRVHVDNSAAKKILITGQFYCADGQDHLLASQRLQKAMNDRFGEVVRLSDSIKTELSLEFQGFYGKLDKNAPEPAPIEEVEPEPFTGPQYPIDDDPKDDERA